MADDPDLSLSDGGGHRYNTTDLSQHGSNSLGVPSASSQGETPPRPTPRPRKREKDNSRTDSSEQAALVDKNVNPRQQGAVQVRKGTPGRGGRGRGQFTQLQQGQTQPKRLVPGRVKPRIAAPGQTRPGQMQSRQIQLGQMQSGLAQVGQRHAGQAVQGQMQLGNMQPALKQVGRMQPGHSAWPQPSSYATLFNDSSQVNAMQSQQEGSLVCDQCEELSAVTNCAECEMNFCYGCATKLHSSGLSVSHQLQPVQQSVNKLTCHECSADAAAFCAECDLRLCQACDQWYHGKGARKRHIRTALQSLAATHPNSSVPSHQNSLAASCPSSSASSYPNSSVASYPNSLMASNPNNLPCQRCHSSPAIAFCQDLDCSIQCCKVCDQTFHSKGKRIFHNRVIGQHGKASIPVHPIRTDSPTGFSPMIRTSRPHTPLASTGHVHSDGISTRSPFTPRSGTAPHNSTPNMLGRNTEQGVSQLSIQSGAMSSSGVLHTQDLPLGKPLDDLTHTSSLADLGKTFTKCQMIPIFRVHSDYQDLDVLTQKVLVEREGIHSVIKSYTSQPTEGGEIDFAQLNTDVTLTTVGLYGNHQNMSRWLLQNNLLDRHDLERLRTAEPGAYCLSNGSSMQFIVYRPTDNAFTELSRKNISCNMMRYLLDLCDHLLVFYSGDEVESFHQKPIAKKHEEKRLHMMVMSFKKESDEDLQLLPGFTANLDTVLANAERDEDPVKLTDSWHTRALHASERLPPRHEFQHSQTESFSQAALESFLQEKTRCYSVTFHKNVSKAQVKQLLILASPSFRQTMLQIGQQTKVLEERLQRQEEELIDKENKKNQAHIAKLDKAVAAYVAKHCPVAKFFCRAFRLHYTLEKVTCMFCRRILSAPWELPCKHAFCKQCIQDHVESDPSTAGKVIVCFVCRRSHKVTDVSKPPGRVASVSHLQQTRSLQEQINRQHESSEEAWSYVQGLHPDIKSRLNKCLAKEVERLCTMERAYAVFSTAAIMGLVIGTVDKNLQKQMESFLLDAASKGKKAVDEFINSKTTGFLRSLVSTSKPRESEFSELQNKMVKRFQKSPLACQENQVFESTKCREAAEMIMDKMKQSLKEVAMLGTELDETIQMARSTTQAQIQSLNTDALEKMLRELSSSVRVHHEPLQLQVEYVELFLEKTSAQYSYEHLRNDQVCRLTFKEQQVSPITHVRQLFTFDLLKSDAEKLQENTSASICSPPMISSKQACFPTSLETHDIVRFYFLKKSRLIVFVRDKANLGIDIYVLKAADYRKRTEFPAPFTSMKRGFIDLIDFDEDSRMVAFHEQGEHRVEVYRFDQDWKHWAPRHSIQLSVHLGTSQVTHMLFVPNGQESLCLLDDKKRCHVFNVQDERVASRPISISSAIDQVLVSLDGSTLLVFSLDERIASESQATIAGSVSYKKVITVHAFSLDSRQLIKDVELDSRQFPPEVLPSLRLVMVGPQMHLVAINKQTRSLVSCHVDIRSARNVFRMTNVDDDSSQGSPSDEDSKRQKNYLEYLYQVYDKFCVEDCLGTSSKVLSLTCMFDLPSNTLLQKLEGGDLCRRFVNNMFTRLADRTHKPMHEFTRKVSVASLESGHRSVLGKELSSCQLGNWIQRLICLVPIQLCCAEHNQLTIFSNGLKAELAAVAQNVCQLQNSVEFGLFEDILDWWTGPVKVVSSMGKQSTGKSYMLNHLTGSLFDISGDRCTDGAWLTIRISQDCLYVVLDFEGLGSMERSDQEDMLLSLLNAAISSLTVFKTEFRVDQDTRNMLSRFRDGVDFIKGDSRLLRGWFYINIKDVDQRDVGDLQGHFRRKLTEICKEDERNFLTKMYRGQLAIQTFPTLGNAEFYSEMDRIRLHLESENTPSFSSGREFKEVLKLLMAKIHMQEWSSFDRSVVALTVDRLRRGLLDAVNLGHLTNHNSEAEPLTLPSGEPFPDEALKLSNGQTVPQIPDSEVLLERSKPDKQLLGPLVNIFTRIYGSRDDSSHGLSAWNNGFQDMLTKICERRSRRVKAWVKKNVEQHEENGDVQILQNEVSMKLTHLSQSWVTCRAKCDKCFYPCILLKYHEGEHDCLGSHRCVHKCDFCKEAGSAAVQISTTASSPDAGAFECGESAGHGGKHNCQKRNHTCNEECCLSDRDNCNHVCAKKTGHERDPNNAEHRCNAQHFCGEQCSLPGCTGKCISPYEQNHKRHECRDTACPEKCCIKGCNNKCAKFDNHFHGEVKAGSQPVKHFCGNQHPCMEECEVKGLCEVISKRTTQKEEFRTSKGCQFEYVKVTEQNGSRKQCCIAIPPNKETHDGPHCCTKDDKVFHSCDHRCPSCGYFCTLEYNHTAKLHSTEHGNMRLTHVVSATDTFIVDTRRYGRGDSGEAEMCNFHCSSLGRGHIHIKLCQDRAKSSARCTTASTEVGIRHETCKYGPNEDIPKDEFTHDAYWKSIGFKDPCGKEDQELFRQCGTECLATEHEKEGTQFYCTGPLWHKPYSHCDLMQLGGEGHIHSSGCHFRCTHSSSGPLHHVLIVDRSGSMGGTDHTPEMDALKSSHNNRLGAVIEACYHYLTLRRSKASTDLVSFIAFNNTANVIFQSEELDPDVLLERMSTVTVGGCTSFSPPLEAAQKVIEAVEYDGKRGCIVVFLSDGCGSFTEHVLRSLLQERVDRGENMLRLHTVMFGEGNSAELERMVGIVQDFSAGDGFASESSFAKSVNAIKLTEHFEHLASSLNKKGGFLAKEGSW